jgi:hypothetical protein
LDDPHAANSSGRYAERRAAAEFVEDVPVNGVFVIVADMHAEQEASR